MDPKASSQPLDPKLQEAYDRVMGMKLDTPSTPQPPTPQPIPSMPVDVPPVTSPIPPTPAPSTPLPTKPEPIKDTPPVMPQIDQPATLPQMPMPQAMPSKPAESPSETVHFGGAPVAHGFVSKAKGKGISPVILIFGGIIFFVAYALIWVRVFNLKLPFLP